MCAIGRLKLVPDTMRQLQKESNKRTSVAYHLKGKCFIAELRPKKERRAHAGLRKRAAAGSMAVRRETIRQMVASRVGDGIYC